MTIARLIAPGWLLEQQPEIQKTYEGEFTDEQILDLNGQLFNAYRFPNFPSNYKGGHVSGPDIDTFRYVFVDLDMKDFKSSDPERSHDYASKEEFIEILLNLPFIPTSIVDSGNGIHAYWRVTDLDAMSYLKLQRRLARHFRTDPQVSKICQLMRIPGTVNTKDPENPKLCELLFEGDAAYTCEDLDRHLKPISAKDLEYCKRHYDNTYNPDAVKAKIDHKMPFKFSQLLAQSQEVKDLWIGESGDRSKGDFRLGILMQANGFTKDEALSVLVNSRKASERSPTHQFNYANDIVGKIFTDNPKAEMMLSSNVRNILSRSQDDTQGTRFRCNRLIDATDHGFRLSHVMGLVGGSGAGKTTLALNIFKWFVELNPEYVHFFVTLEQPEHEIAERWASLCGDNHALHEKVEVLGNYNEDGSYRNLSLSEIKDYVLKFKEKTGKQIGCICLDHIGVLKKKSQNDEFQGLTEICQQLKSFAVQTNSFFIVQSQTSREKAGIGDLELNKDAAFGTSTFENFVDFLLTLWQPLKRVYDSHPDMTVISYKFCKIRKKHVKRDRIKEDVRYLLHYDPFNERLRELTEDEIKSFAFCNQKATTLRGKDRKTDVLEYKSADWMNQPDDTTQVVLKDAIKQ